MVKDWNIGKVSKNAKCHLIKIKINQKLWHKSYVGHICQWQKFCQILLKNWKANSKYTGWLEDEWGIDTGFVGVFSLLLLKLHSQLPWHAKHFLSIFMNCQNMHFIQIIMHMAWVKKIAKRVQLRYEWDRTTKRSEQEPTYRVTDQLTNEFYLFSLCDIIIDWWRIHSYSNFK